MTRSSARRGRAARGRGAGAVLGVVALSLFVLSGCAARRTAEGGLPAAADAGPAATPAAEAPASRTTGRTDPGARFDAERAAAARAMAEGRLAAAEAHALGAVTAAVSFGDDDPRRAVALRELAAFYVMQGRYEAAEGPARQAAELNWEILGPGHEDTLLALENYAAVLTALGRESEADEIYERARGLRDLR
jgi:tetratricopeptide (TPR) repeat protein